MTTGSTIKNRAMETRVYKNWWILAANGVIAILFGLLLIAFKEDTIKTIVKAFGVVVLLCGVLLVALAIRNIRKDKGSLMIILEAVLTIAIGLIILIQPTESLKLFLTLIGIWAVIIGIVQLVILINIKDAVKNKNILLINSLVTLGLGVALILIPDLFAGFLVIIVGLFALVLGILMIYFSFVLRSVKFVPEKKADATEVK
jgi:uncharacterized membrane protein HdeD (DUF308 family)